LAKNQDSILYRTWGHSPISKY